MLPTSTDVLIVGAGPTGLALAIALQQAGIRHVLVDKLAQGQNTSRAAVIHAHTLEALEPLGVSDMLMRKGLSLTKFAIRDRDRPLVELSFDTLPSPYQCLLMIPQDETERILADRLKELGGTVHRGVTVTAVDQDASGVRVRYSAADGDHVAQAKYVVGADGMHSLVRTASAISFEGGTYEESFILADVKMQWPLGTDEVSLFFSPEGLVVVAPLPDGNFRVVAIMEGAPEQPTVRDVQGLIDRRGPTTGICRVEKVVWSSRFRIHHRVVNTYRDGRLYLMGDAAHVHSPAGGQGMNTGLVDAVVLAKVLVKAVKDGASKEVVEAYSRLRRPAAVEVLGLAGRLTNMATTRGSLKRRVRNLMLRLLNAVPAAKRRLVLNLSGLARRRYADSV